ncbi:MAG: hypothetical protein JSV24_06770 [Bacteroidales bacterium]|nr:MAG: hypothetical protein JSV24_06770 [Bacteroidales bacterium]
MKRTTYQGMFTLTLSIWILISGISADAQSGKRNKDRGSFTGMDTSLYNNLRYRHIGPFRGGRSAAVTGVTEQPGTYYMGATGGGVWKTTDSGRNWENISDGYFGGTIGAVDVSRSDPNIVFTAGGEVTVRGNVSHGYGIWKSVDAGESWKYMGLKEGQYIPRIRIHPENPDLVYAAVLGHVFGPGPERGVYRSEDGGKSWEKILFVNEDAGACDLILDPVNPRIIYASTWRVRRTPYSLESGGEGSCLWKSVDGGDHWSNITGSKGLPGGTIGIIGITVSPVNHKRLWAMVEAAQGGLFRSEDAGISWTRVNEDRNLRQRAWYYTRVYADTESEDIVYVLNVGFHRSKDGGKTFERIRTPHADHHDLWISPLNSDVMIIADDGGAQVSIDNGASWSTYMNQPTAQFYRVATDNHFPYRIYAAQQDNSTVRIVHRSTGRSGITEDDWEPTAGGESGYIAPDPKDPDIVYGGSYGGYLVRVNHRTGEERAIDVWPDNPMGWGAKELKYRFQWNYPILFSRHNPNTLYCAANVLFRTTSDGQNWEVISPDLTRNDTSKMGPSGGPITKDNTSVEYYGTIFAVTESFLEEGVIWTGSDDGLVYITKDNGNTWENVTPPASIMPEWTMINSLEPNPSEKGGLYIAATSYKHDDFHPYLYKTTDYGETWFKITSGIDEQHFTRVIRADPHRPGLLYAGTESGMYISFDDGNNWQDFNLNLPTVPVTDLAVKENDLIVATQGRSLWILDDLTVLHQLSGSISDKPFQLFQPRDAYIISGGRGGRGSGENPPNGPVFNIYLKDAPDSSENIRLTLFEPDGDLIKSYHFNPGRRRLEGHLPLGKLDLQKGMNRFAWDMTYPGAKRFEGLIMWGGRTSGPVAPPGEYIARFVLGNDSSEVKLTLLKDPGSSSTPEDLKKKFAFLIETRDKLTETHQCIIEIREITGELNRLKEKTGMETHQELRKEISRVSKELKKIEEALYQTRNRSPQDPLNYPIRLNNKLASLSSTVSTGNYAPTDQACEVKDSIIAAIDEQLREFYRIKEKELPGLNEMALEMKIPAIRIE